MSTPNAQLAYQYFIGKGWSPVQAAAIVGNLMQESGPNLDISVVGDAGTAFGIAQWRGDRYAALQDFAASIGAPFNQLSTQLAFVDYELRNSEARAGDALRAATTLEDANAAMISFERPQGWTWENPSGGHGWANRLNYAAGLAGLPATGGGAAPSPGVVPNAAPNTPNPAENSQNPPVPAPETPIANAFQAAGQAFSAPQAGQGASRVETPQTPRLAAADFAENSRNRLAEITSALMPTPETGLGAAEQPMRAFNQPFTELMQKPDPFKVLFGPARNAPLGGGTRIRA